MTFFSPFFHSFSFSLMFNLLLLPYSLSACIFYIYLCAFLSLPCYLLCSQTNENDKSIWWTRTLQIIKTMYTYKYNKSLCLSCSTLFCWLNFGLLLCLSSERQTNSLYICVRRKWRRRKKESSFFVVSNNRHRRTHIIKSILHLNCCSALHFYSIGLIVFILFIFISRFFALYLFFASSFYFHCVTYYVSAQLVSGDTQYNRNKIATNYGMENVAAEHTHTHSRER